MTFIASATGSTGVAAQTVDTSGTLTIAAGDVLVCYVAGDYLNTSVTGVAEDDASNAFTLLTTSTRWWALTGSYLVSAGASAGATIRATLAANSNSDWGIVVLQFRPAPGESVAYATHNLADSAWGTNPTSGAVTTASTNSLFVGGATNDRSAMSNHLIAGAGTDGDVQFSWSGAYLDASYTVFASAQTSKTYATTASNGVWGADVIVIDITIAGGVAPTAVLEGPLVGPLGGPI